MRSHLFVPWLATVTSAIDTCGYLVTDPLAANLLHARESCSSFQQSTNSLCPTTVTSTRVITTTAAITSTTIQTVVLTNNATSSITRTSVTILSPSATLTTRTTTTSLNANPTGPIGGSSDLNKRAAEAIQCPRLTGPDVPGPFAFFCQPSSFSSACRQVGILPTTQTRQSTVTVTTSTTSTVRPTSIRTLATTTTTTATLNATVVTTTTTTLPTPTSTVTETHTAVPGVGPFFLSARGVAYNGPISGTSTIQAGDPITLSSTNRPYYVFRINNLQGLVTGAITQFSTFVNNDYVVRFSGYIDPNTDSRTLRCDLSRATSGNLTCVSGLGSQTTKLFQTCNNDGKLYHAPSLLAGCTTLQLYTSSL